MCTEHKSGIKNWLLNKIIKIWSMQCKERRFESWKYLALLHYLIIGNTYRFFMYSINLIIGIMDAWFVSFWLNDGIDENILINNL